MTRLDAFREKISAGRVPVGVFVTMSDMAVGEMAGWAGYDYIWIDAEHAPLGRQEILRLVIAAQSAGACAFVRVPGVDPYQVKAILDLGPDGIIFPFVNTKELAETAVASCAYPSRGMRGQGPIRAIRYGLDDEATYLDGAYSKVLKILQIESLEGYGALDGILEVPGIDSLFIGSADLGRSLNDFSEAGKKRFDEIFGDICARVRAKNILLGAASGPNAKEVSACVEKGVQWVVCGQDVRILSQGLKANLDAIRGTFP